MRQIAWSNISGKLDEAWRRFRALSWKRKALALSLAALCALGVALFVVAVAGGGDGGSGLVGSPGARHGRAAFALTPTPPPPPTPTATPPPPPAATPVAGAYTLTQALPSATFDQMLAFALIPGASNQAVIATQGGDI